MNSNENNEICVASFYFFLRPGSDIMFLIKCFHAEYESGLKSCLSRQVIKKKGVETPKNSVFGHFWKIASMKPDLCSCLKIKPDIFTSKRTCQKFNCI